MYITIRIKYPQEITCKNVHKLNVYSVSITKEKY